MNFSLIICTYKRPEPLLKLLRSVEEQTLAPSEILVVDGSPDDLTKKMLEQNLFENLKYFQVEEKDRGLTRQRNFGISKVSPDSEVICFLDDDTVLKKVYFEQLIATYDIHSDAIGVAGYILSDVKWEKREPFYDEFGIEGFSRKLGSRNVLRKKFGLLSDQPPGIMPAFSNGFSTGFYPPTGKTYPVEFFMGGVASYRKELFEKIKFSSYFEGYGLYEDMDFCLRASEFGQLYLNTAAQLYHYHEELGRPNRYNYGKMVIRNGWYVWRVKYPSPGLKVRLKWNAIALLLTLVRMGNIFTTRERKAAFTESLGRIAGWWSLIFNKPSHEA
ncbi:Glycosyltransferase, GT2 family [Salinimicrobium catena]|uniref:Glycosyltransferase, GT2 family n=1 Tax=Salinimicrobium catena TaxID=390640 RepID=A0A1H5N9T0_9FLAO|nr:glycosyltransferase family 2 protein [Salinimicrobium catena]SDL40876.1 Glycosyltransferase, GT2 family [Salinimicrobium catena]SEE98429.1 Glycosyltransferase, GT2 family [Salinimicrobium catena]